MRIFMSYRREDSADVSGRIYDKLVEHFGDDIVFKDVDNIPFGVDFKSYLANAIADSAVELVVIGPKWLTVSNERGQRRLDDPADFVHIEIEAALDRNMPVIPLLVRGASMPKEDELPSPLRRLAFRNGTPVRPDPDFHRDMDRLISGLEQYVKPQSKQAAPRQQVAVAPAAAPAGKEATFYNDGKNRVTNRVAQLDGTTHALADVSSVSMEKIAATKKETLKASIPTYVAFAAFFGSICLGMASPDSSATGAISMVAFAACAITIMYANWQLRTRFAVRVRNASGQQDIFVSTRKAMVKKITEAISKAIAYQP